MTLLVYGRSDDLVYIEDKATGESEELYLPAEDHLYLAFSDGAVVLIEYGEAGRWLVDALNQPTAGEAQERPAGWQYAPVDYTEAAVLTGKPEWFVANNQRHDLMDGEGE